MKEDIVFPCVPELFFSKERFHSSVELHNKEDILKLLVEDLVKNLVMWGKCKIKIVVALSMAAKDFKLLFKIFRMVYKDFNYDKKLYQIKTFEEFEKYIFE